jgi:phosphatidate cytidylyltransferase
MSNLTLRLITGSVFVVVLVSAIWFSVWTMALLFLVIAILGLLEFYRLAEKATAQPLRIYGTVLGALIVAGAFVLRRNIFPEAALSIIPAFFLIFFIELYRKKANPFANIGWSILGLVYIALPIAMLIMAFVPEMNQSVGWYGDSWESHYDWKPVLVLFVLIWVSDSLAYVCGRLFGKNKLWERISPKKTWEGFIGGTIFCVGTGFAFGHWLMDDKGTMKYEIMWSLIALTTAVTGMLGDLVESLFKRSINEKDSGTILPGHGGILDRFDALFLSVPFTLTVYWLCDAFLA